MRDGCNCSRCRFGASLAKELKNVPNREKIFAERWKLLFGVDLSPTTLANIWVKP